MDMMPKFGRERADRGSPTAVSCGGPDRLRPSRRGPRSPPCLHLPGLPPPRAVLPLRLVVGPLLGSDPGLLVGLAECFLAAAALGLGFCHGADGLPPAARTLVGTSLRRLLRRRASLLAACLFLGPPLRLFLRDGTDLLRHTTCLVGGLPAGLRLCNGTDLLRGTACLLVGASLSLRCHPRLLAACLLGGLALGLRLCNRTDLLRHTTS